MNSYNLEKLPYCKGCFLQQVCLQGLWSVLWLLCSMAVWQLAIQRPQPTERKRTASAAHTGIGIPKQGRRDSASLRASQTGSYSPSFLGISFDKSSGPADAVPVPQAKAPFDQLRATETGQFRVSRLLGFPSWDPEAAAPSTNPKLGIKDSM